MKKYKYIIPILLISLLLILVFSNSFFVKAETITISGIKAHDFFSHEPSTYNEVRDTLLNRPEERTGYSGKLYVCLKGAWVQEGEDINTDDSGRDKRYSIADYSDEIVKLYGNKVYEQALESGESLVFDASKGKKEIYSSKNTGTPLPCKDGENGYFYNNLDFWLTVSFTKNEIIPPPSSEAVRIEPAERIVEVGQSATYKLSYYDKNGNKSDVTQSATWSINSSTIGKASSKGSFEGLAVGSTGVKATYNGLSDNANFKVIEAKAKPEVTIYGPTKVKAGDEFSLFAGAHVDGGTIDQYIWDHPGSSGGKPNEQNLNQLYYMTEGEKYVSVAVEDNFNQWAFDEHNIEVTPPTPVASMHIGGTYKENRKVILRSASSSPTYFPITETYFTIEPMDGQSINSIKSKLGHVDGGKYVISGLDVNASIDLLFKEKGTYKFYHYVKNSAGLSDDTETLVTIAPDLPPVANFNMETKVYRDAKDDNNASITLSVPPGYDESKDNDLIKQRIWKYRYDSDNDGNYAEESWVILDQTNKTSVIFKSKNVGRYEFSLEIVEDFGQPTILEFIVPSDYKRGNSDHKPLEEKILLIDNRAPTVSWGP